MKQKLRWFPAAALLFLSCCLFSFVVAGRLAEGIWKQLGITQQDGADRIKKSFLDGYFHYAGLKAAKNIATGDRAATTTDLLAYTKQYIGTPYFKAAYDKLRTESKPSQPMDNTKTKEQIRQAQIAETKDALAKMETYAKTVSADQQKSLKPVLDMHRQNLKDYQDPASKMIGDLYQAQLDSRKRELDSYQKYTKEWEINYPADYRGFVRSRVNQYLSIANTVDFSAKVHEKNGKMVFDKSDYQYKSNDWKMIYRAGKEVYDVTKPFAEKWLQELQ